MTINLTKTLQPRLRFTCLLPLFCIALLCSCQGKAREADQKAAGQKEVVCFIYHRFGDARYPTTNVSVKDFDAHLAWLVRNNFRIITFSKAIEYLNSDEPVQKTAVITIDDGYKSFYEKGLPLLKKYGLPATLFINTETIGGNDYMGWAELTTAMKTNIEIGNHTHSHRYFMNVPRPDRYTIFKDEIAQSQALIEKHLQIKPVVFAYPYGEFDAEMKAIVKEAGFTGAAAQNSGVMCEDGDLFQCPRFPMSEAYASPKKFVEKASTRALRLTYKLPDNTVSASNRPVLTMSFDPSGLSLSQLQCFIQGSECDVKIVEKKNDKVTFTMQAKTPISGRRRTLYTLTVRDKEGAWHWYSHLWINAKVK